MREGTPGIIEPPLARCLCTTSINIPQSPQPPRAIGTSVTSGNFRDFWKNDDDDEKRFLFLYLRVLLKAISVG